MWNNYISETKDINRGVAQRNIISPILFNIFLNDIPHLPMYDTYVCRWYTDNRPIA